MPLYKTINVNNSTKVLIWKIEQPLVDLSQGIELTKNSKNRLDSMKSELHQRGFLSIRHLLKEVGLVDADLMYDEFTFTGIIISDKVPVGIDIEMQRDKILKIAHKFTPFQEYKTIANADALISKLTIVWGAKESLYKIFGKKKLRFLEHIYIEDFKFEDEKTSGTIDYNNETNTYQVYFLEFEGFTCVYAF